MRIIVADCSAEYTGRLNATLPLAKRVLLIKADGSVLIFSELGAYKPLNWMVAPCGMRVLRKEDSGESDAGVVVDGCILRVAAAKSDDLLMISLEHVYSDNTYDLGEDPGLIKDGVEVITPDPKSSGGACWNFLAALSYARDRYNSEDKQKEFLRKLYDNVSVLDSGARGSTTTFVENKKGDVLIAWENEALTSLASYPDEYEIVTPSVSVLAQPSVAVVDDNVKVNKTEELASEYLSFLYSKQAQRIAADYGYRPTDEEVLNEYSSKFNLTIKLDTIADYGGWTQAYKIYFDDGGWFDEIYNN